MRNECVCTPTDISVQTRFGDATEPGSTMEPNPECQEHFPQMRWDIDLEEVVPVI